MRKRPVLLATLAVVLVGAAGATSVFLVGSKQRRDDRRAYLAYERAVLVPLAEVRRLAAEMLVFVEGAPPDRIKLWRDALQRIRAQILGETPPTFLRDVRARWAVAVDAYKDVADLLRFTETPYASALAIGRADDLFNRAAELMQLHRRRLGLGATAELPDPASERSPE